MRAFRIQQDEEAMTFERAYNSFYKSIYKFTYSLMGSAEEAEDMTQETFLKLHNVMSEQDELENTKYWLYRVAANACYNQLKRQKLFHKLITLNFTGDAHHAPRQNPIEDEYIRGQEQAMVRKALDQLPPKDRVILMLYQDKFSYAQMAEMLNIKATSIGKILSRAREKLVQQIRQGEGQ